MDGMGKEGGVFMYHYIQDKNYLKRLRSTCSDIVNQLVQVINNDSIVKVRACLVGSGAKNLVTQNANQPIDFDFNIIIVNAKSINIRSCREIKEYVRKQFNKVLNKNGWGDCQDSTSALTTEKRVFQSGDKISFSIDLAITYRNKHGWHRLIHRKTGVVASDEYYWNEVPNSMQLEKKVDAIKSRHLWNEVKDTYLDKKNFYLRRNDDAHPSFIVYIETVNQICDKHHI